MEKLVTLYQFVDNNEIPFYVGITNNIKRRLTEHKTVLKKGKSGKTWPVYNKIRKLIREENYELKMIVIKSGLNFEEAKQLEIETIAKYKHDGIRLCNLTAGGDGTTNHKPVFTEEWKRNLKEARKKIKCSGEYNNFYGQKHTKETKKRLSELRVGKNMGSENSFYGKKHSDETLKIMADTAKKTFTGKPKSKEQKRKMSDSAKGRINSDEHNEKNRLKSSIPYKIFIIETTEEFVWLRGAKTLSEYLLDNYRIKITAAALTTAVKNNRPTRKLIITKFQQGI